jgi:hypothetical protein
MYDKLDYLKQINTPISLNQNKIVLHCADDWQRLQNLVSRLAGFSSCYFPPLWCHWLKTQKTQYVFTNDHVRWVSSCDVAMLVFDIIFSIFSYFKDGWFFFVTFFNATSMFCLCSCLDTVVGGCKL